MKKITFAITGMHCASCVVRNEKALKKVPGVTEVSVNFALKQATATYDETQASEHDLHEAVRSIGYDVVATTEENEHQKHESMEHSGNEAIHGGNEHTHHVEAEDAKKKAVLALILALPVAVVGMFGVEFGAMVYGHALSMWLMAILGSAVILVVGWQFHVGMFKEMRHAAPGMDSLISLGTLAAFAYSAWVLIIGSGEVYFETGAIITALILLGKYFEARSTGQASEAIQKLLELGAKMARVLVDGKEVEVPIEKVQVGDVFVVRPGEKVSTDGIIEKGSSALDESMLTGESIPADKKEGDQVFGATINTNGLLHVRATKVGEGTMLAQIVKMVSEAQEKKAPMQRLADRISGMFVPVVLVLAALTALGWYLKTGQIAQSIIPAVAVLVIACPCALGLATPTAIMVGTGLGARRGILIKNGEALEKAKRIDTVIFDKTGTLTQGKAKVTDIVALAQLDAAQVLQIAASIEKGSEHPIAQAVVEHAKEKHAALYDTQHFSAVPGKGVKGVLQIAQIEREVTLGTMAFLEQQGVDVRGARNKLEQLQNEGKTAMTLAVEKKVIGFVAVADTLHSDAKSAIDALRRAGIEPLMITGDNWRTAHAIGEQLGISEKNILAEVLPQDKAREVKKLQENGRRVAFVGDGINDAPALTQSDLGIAMGSGTDIAIEAGSVVLVHGSPLKAVEAIRLSRLTFRVIKQNLFWAFFYNIAALPLAAFGFLNPIIAAAAMAFSSVSVVANSLRIKRAKLR